jgi:hypothetical protein
MAAHASVYDEEGDRMIVIGSGQYNRMLAWDRNATDASCA